VSPKFHHEDFDDRSKTAVLENLRHTNKICDT